MLTPAGFQSCIFSWLLKTGIPLVSELSGKTKMSLPNTTLDRSEVERHNKIGEDWWNTEGTIKGLHTFNTLRIPYIIDGIIVSPEQKRSSKPLANKKILDIGCGAGIVTEALAEKGAEATGVDPSDELIDLAKRHCVVRPEIQSNIKYFSSTIEEHAEKFPNYYDAVVASEVIDHVADVELFLKLCLETLKPGGKIFITAPNRTRLSQFLMIYVAENILKVIPKGIHAYEKFRSPDQVKEIFQKYNCEVNNVHGLIFNPLTCYWRWSYFQTLWYALDATKRC